MTEPIIEVENLTREFGAVKAVQGISFTVQPGEIFAFLGPNGAGKSTTIKILTTLLPPTSGQVRLAGHDVQREPDAVRQAFGIVFQDPSVDDQLTAYENMELHAVMYNLPRAEVRRRVEELLELVELSDRAGSLVKTFSGGMRRRLEIARGLLHRPHVLFLDEPTIGLDAQTRHLLWDYVRRLNEQEGMTVFFTTHYLEEADEAAQRIAIIDHGEIVARGTSAELKRQTGADDLEAAYLKLTGTGLRDEGADANGQLQRRMRARGSR